MVSFTVIVSSAVVKGARFGTMASKVKSTFSKLSKPGVVPVTANRLRRRRPHRELRKRASRKSLPSVLAPLPDDLATPLLTQFEAGLSMLPLEVDVVSDDSHSSQGTESTLVDSDTAEESKKRSHSSFTRSKAAQNVAAVTSSPTATDLRYDATNDVFYAREEANASELALSEIKVVAKDILPQEEYYAAEGLVPTEGYEISLEVQ
ncbi:hypothetical protein BN946_scf184998.g11 [Trametes cinnabarina]|uniref:Uncharacterized protein n=1 Tax=Pycnoporus cinnabarinus TaxID=5643 RepID=A0A060S8B2_PYCCI|nr:hypothetical protein BN946_scf184998.g11 [Trametes cinnabarina]